MCGGHRINKGRREVKYVGCRHAADDKSKNSERKLGKEDKSLGLMSTQRGQSQWPDKGSVPRPAWAWGEPTLRIL